jgi:hypothetical protein
MSTSDVITPRLVAGNPPVFLSFTRGTGLPVTMALDAIEMVAPDTQVSDEYTVIHLKTGNRIVVCESYADVMKMIDR